MDFEQLKHLGDEIIMNHSRMKEIKSQLEANSFNDQLVKYIGLAIVVFTTVATIFSRIQQVKRLTRGTQQPAQAQEGFSMVPRFKIRISSDVQASNKCTESKFL